MWQFDFCDTLLFPTIAVTKVHVSAESGFPVVSAPLPPREHVMREDLFLTYHLTEPRLRFVALGIDNQGDSTADQEL